MSWGEIGHATNSMIKDPAIKFEALDIAVRSSVAGYSKIFTEASVSWKVPFTGLYYIYCLGSGGGGGTAYNTHITYRHYWLGGGGGGSGYFTFTTAHLTKGSTFTITTGVHQASIVHGITSASAGGFGATPNVYYDGISNNVVNGGHGGSGGTGGGGGGGMLTGDAGQNPGGAKSGYGGNGQVTSGYNVSNISGTGGGGGGYISDGAYPWGGAGAGTFLDMPANSYLNNGYGGTGGGVDFSNPTGAGGIGGQSAIRLVTGVMIPVVNIFGTGGNGGSVSGPWDGTKTYTPPTNGIQGLVLIQSVGGMY